MGKRAGATDWRSSSGRAFSGDLVGRPDGARLLAPWDEQLATLGSEILHRRLETLASWRRRSARSSVALAPDVAGVTLSYEASVAPAADRDATRQALLDALVRPGRGRTRRG